MGKYIKPRSVTWWASVIPLVLGLASATAPLHGMVGLEQTVTNLTGGMSSYTLINAGLIGIGLRGAIK